MLLLLLAFFLSAAAVAAAAWFLSSSSSSSHLELRLPPGSVGLPLIGESLSLIAAYKTSNPEPFIDDRVRRHGSRIFTTHVFGERTVFSADAEFNRLVLSGEGRVVECSYPSSISTLLGPNALLLMRGQPHKRLYSLTLATLASPAAFRGGKLFASIDRLVRASMAEWAPSVRLMEEAKKITFDLTVKQLVSLDPGPWSEGLRREYVRVMDGFFSIPFPPFLSFTTYGRAIKARRKVADALKEVIRRRKEERNVREREGRGTEDDGGRKGSRFVRRKDMVEELLQAEGGSLSEEVMVDFLFSLLVAGYETTSTIMTLAVKFLTEAPSALAQIKEEHNKIRAMKTDDMDPLDWSDYKSMPFTQCVISETLRVTGNISGVFRRATTDIHFKGYTIPKGCKIFASFRAVHLDRENYENARVFDPWRWQSNDALQQSTAAGVFTPFGGGPRLCPGYELARVVCSVFLHYFVTCLSWEAEGDEVIFFPTTRTVKGYPITVRKRGRPLVS